MLYIRSMRNTLLNKQAQKDFCNNFISQIQQLVVIRDNEYTSYTARSITAHEVVYPYTNDAIMNFIIDYFYKNNKSSNISKGIRIPLLMRSEFLVWFSDEKNCESLDADKVFPWSSPFFSDEEISNCELTRRIVHALTNGWDNYFVLWLFHLSNPCYSNSILMKDLKIDKFQIDKCYHTCQEKLV